MRRTVGYLSHQGATPGLEQTLATLLIAPPVETDSRRFRIGEERRPSRRFVKTRLRMYRRLAIDHSPTPRRQIKRMSAGKTIPLYLESRERSLPLSAAPWNPLNSQPPPRAPRARESFYVAAAERKLTVYSVLIQRYYAGQDKV